MNFKAGDTVTWTSSSQRSTTTKTGKIIAIVPKKTRLDQVITAVIESRHNISPIRWSYYSWEEGYAVYRSEPSYLVSVPSNSKAKPKLYWPRVSQLHLVEESH